jgi:hypothetical protein
MEIYISPEKTQARPAGGGRRVVPPRHEPRT